MAEEWVCSPATDMRVLVMPKNLEIGGTQLHAIDVASELSHRGVEIRVLAEPGPLIKILVDKGIEWKPLDSPDSRLLRFATIAKEVRTYQPDVIHAYEVRAILDACLSARLCRRTSVLGSILSTRVPWFLPESVPLTVGMPELAEFTRRWRTGRTALIESPIDPGLATSETFPAEGQLEDDKIVLVLVSRLVEPFKREGILRTISAMHELGPKKYRLFIVGDGPARPIFERAATALNDGLGDEVVRFTGAMTDPTPALAAAHAVVGNGVSTIRSAAAGKPTVVVGREGFSEVVTPDVVESLRQRGFYGVGAGLAPDDALPGQIEMALAPDRKHDLDKIAHAIVDRYAIESVGLRISSELKYSSSLRGPTTWSLVRSLSRRVYYRLRRSRLVRQARGLGLVDETANNHVYGRLRDLALPPAEWGTGKNRSAP